MNSSISSGKEFADKQVSDNYNKLLQEKLDETTSSLERAIETLRIKNLELEVIYENVDFGIVQRTYDDKTGTMSEFVNQKALEIFGIDRDTYDSIRADGKTNLMLYEDISEGEIKRALDNLSEDSFLRDTLKAVRSDGQTIWISIYVAKVDMSESGTTVIITIQDVTEEEDYKHEIMQRNEELVLSERLYEIALNHTETIVFDYDIINNRMVQSHNTMMKYGFPTVIEDPINTIIASGAIHENYVDDFREAYERVHRGEPNTKVKLTVIDKDGKEIPSEISLTTIYDSEGNPSRAVGILADISEIIKLEHERQYKDSLISDKVLIYEANITANKMEYISSEWIDKFCAPEIKTYEEFLDYVCMNVVYGEDVKNYRMLASRSAIEENIENNKLTQVLEYRRQINEHSYTWVQGTFNTIRDALTGEVKVRCYINQIDNEKKKEFELLYLSEHDALTGLYNRGTLNQRVKAYLAGDGKNGKHAFLLFDIDMFKQINDNFGHSFGDAVLSKVAAKVKELFRDDDILGRIGGDEFVVFMKNVPSQKMALKKAKELCTNVYESYTQNGIKHNVSTSVGIAMYKEHGMGYQKLYDRSDAAMYAAKKSGRNRAVMYDRNMQASESEICDEHIDSTVGKTFDENVAEYVFKILYESNNKISAINSVLELIGKHYQVSRAYIFENTDDGLRTNNTFEWCNATVESEMDKLQNIEYANLGNYMDNFNQNGVYYLSNIENAVEEEKELLRQQNITSMIQFAIIKNGDIVGFIGFDQCGFARSVSKTELSELKVIANILGVFLIEMRALKANEEMKNMALSIVDSLGSYAYVIDGDTCEILFINAKTRSFVPDANIGDKCYSAFWGNESKCDACPMRKLSNKKGEPYTTTLYNRKLDISTKATASWIDWPGGKKACLIDSVDITEYVGRLENKV